MLTLLLASIALLAFLGGRVGASDTASPALVYPQPVVIKNAEQAPSSNFFANLFLRGFKTEELEEVEDLESVSSQALVVTQFAKYAYYETDDCTGFIKSMISVKLDTCMKVLNQQVSFKFSAGTDSGVTTIYQQMYSDGRCSSTKVSGAPVSALQAPTGCNSVAGSNLYAEPTIVTELPTQDEFFNGVRVTVYNTAESCLMDQVPTAGGNRADPPEANVLEMDFSTHGYCWKDSVYSGSDMKFISCERNTLPTGDSNIFFVATYPSTDGSCTGAATTMFLRKRHFCRKRRDTYAGLGLGFLSMTCY
eukprot:gene25760-31111_t